MLLTMPKSEVSAALRALRKRSGRPVQAIADALKVPKSTYYSYERTYKRLFLPMELVHGLLPVLVGHGQPPITSGEVLALGGASNTDETAVLAEGFPKNRDSIPINVRPAPDVRLPLPHFGERQHDLPVYGTAEAGPDGAMDIQIGATDLAVDRVVRPRMLQGARDAFAFYVTGTSMESRWRPGELVFVNPARHPAPGDPVLAVLSAGRPGDPQRALFKYLVRRTATKIVLRQLNPEMEIEIPLSEIRNLWRVYEWSELVLAL